MDAEERDLFAKTLQQLAAQHDGAALDAALDDLGWRDALADDPQAAVSALFEQQGRAGSSSSALDDVVVGALGLDPAGDLAAVLPPLGRTDPPGAADGGGLAVCGLGTSGLRRRPRAAVAGDGTVAVVDTAGLELRPVDGLDPRLELVEAAADGVATTSQADLPPAAWAAGVAAGQRALAHELVGASRTMLDLARTHALERIQFDRPIAQFQAVRHRLAESLVAVEAADAALGAAWDDPSPLGSAVAKAIAGRSARTVARHCQQVLAGIGFTTEHPLHRYVGRIIVLDGLLGDARTLTRRMGEDLLAQRSVPAILPL
jgi:alkylation response protein AidB-like acyl-CoA dehydrogenase